MSAANLLARRRDVRRRLDTRLKDEAEMRCTACLRFLDEECREGCSHVTDELAALFEERDAVETAMLEE